MSNLMNDTCSKNNSKIIIDINNLIKYPNTHNLRTSILSKLQNTPSSVKNKYEVYLDNINILLQDEYLDYNNLEKINKFIDLINNNKEY